ncbi:MAG: trypsin-like peptidase domain-containing protein [Dehalococcoidia bacterium]|nr:trypsin-like peptidase domain-containing protein [Dehalococcoidia bacterium]
MNRLGANKRWLLPSMLVLALSVSTLGGCDLYHTVTVTEPVETNYPGIGLAAFDNLADVIDAVRPAVVYINTVSTYQDPFKGMYSEESAGSGFVVSHDGWVVTNSHLVDVADTISVIMDDGRVFEAVEKRTDVYTDLAVVKINAENLQPLTIGDSEVMRMGDWVVAVGNSLGMGISATKGIVTACDVSKEMTGGNVLYNLLQTDAAVNAYNSGGPLINIYGEVVGINSTEIYQAGESGVGYVVSINEAAFIIHKLIEEGVISRPDIGANILTVNQAYANRYGLAVNSGALITKVAVNGPAAQAGLLAGDVITAVNDMQIASASNFKHYLQNFSGGDEVNISYCSFADKKIKTVNVLLVEAT